MAEEARRAEVARKVSTSSARKVSKGFTPAAVSDM